MNPPATPNASGYATQPGSTAGLSASSSSSSVDERQARWERQRQSGLRAYPSFGVMTVPGHSPPAAPQVPETVEENDDDEGNSCFETPGFTTTPDWAAQSQDSQISIQEVEAMLFNDNDARSFHSSGYASEDEETVLDTKETRETVDEFSQSTQSSFVSASESQYHADISECEDAMDDAKETFEDSSQYSHSSEIIPSSQAEEEDMIPDADDFGESSQANQSTESTQTSRVPRSGPTNMSEHIENTVHVTTAREEASQASHFSYHSQSSQSSFSGPTTASGVLVDEFDATSRGMTPLPVLSESQESGSSLGAYTCGYQGYYSRETTPQLLRTESQESRDFNLLMFSPVLSGRDTLPDDGYPYPSEPEGGWDVITPRASPRTMSRELSRTPDLGPTPVNTRPSTPESQVLQWPIPSTPTQNMPELSPSRGSPVSRESTPLLTPQAMRTTMSNNGSGSGKNTYLETHGTLGASSYL
ncbi:unnamed protein product [Somion occarium]